MIIGFRKFVNGKLTDLLWVNTEHYREIVWTQNGKGAMKMVNSMGMQDSLLPEEAEQVGGRLLIEYPMPLSDGKRTHNASRNAPEDPDMLPYTAGNGDLCWINLQHWSRVLWRPQGTMQLIPSYVGPKKVLPPAEATQVGPWLARKFPPVTPTGKTARALPAEVLA